MMRSTVGSGLAAVVKLVGFFLAFVIFMGGMMAANVLVVLLAVFVGGASVGLARWLQNL